MWETSYALLLEFLLNEKSVYNCSQSSPLSLQYIVSNMVQYTSFRTTVQDIKFCCDYVFLH